MKELWSYGLCTEDCRVVLQFNYEFASESKVSPVRDACGNESSTTQRICRNLLPFKGLSIRHMQVEKALVHFDDIKYA